MSDICECCKQEITKQPIADKINCWVMYDNHTFGKLEAGSPKELVNKWLDLIRVKRGTPCPGPPDLCPVTVLSGDKELRRVGEMIHFEWDYYLPDREKVKEFVKALEADEDIVRIMKELERGAE